MSCMKEEVLKEASIEVVDPYSMISCSDTVKVGVTTMLYIVLNEYLYLNGCLITGMYYICSRRYMYCTLNNLHCILKCAWII